MMRFGLRSRIGWQTALSAVLAAGVWAGCGGPQTVEMPEPEAPLRPANVAASLDRAADLDAVTRPVDEAETATRPVVATPRPAQQPNTPTTLDAEEQQAQLGQAQRRAAFNHFMRSGRDLLNRGRFEEAVRAFEEAVQLIPDDPQAQQMLAQTRGLLGREGGRAFADFQAAQNRERGQISEALAQIRLKHSEGKRLFDERRYRDAQRLFNEALEIARWLRGRVDTSADEAYIRGLLTQAEELAREQQQRDLRHNELLVQQIREVEKANRIRRFREEVRTLFETAKAQFDRGEYDECIITLNKIIWQDPYNEEVTRLREYCRDLKYRRQSERAKREMAHRWQLTLAEIQDAAIPHVAAMFEAELPAPERWREIETRALRVLDRQVTREDADVARIREQLRQQTVTLRYPSQLLTDVVYSLMENTGVNITVSPQLLNTPDTDDLRINIADSITLRLNDALTYITERVPAGAGWYIENGAVEIGTREEAAGKGLARRSFNVADLLSGFTPFPGDIIPFGRVPEDPPDEPDRQSIDLLDLSDLIEAVVAPGSWNDEGVTKDESDVLRTIFVRHRPEVLNEIAQLLDDLRQSRGLMVTVEVRFVEVQDNFLEEIGIDYRGGGGVPPGAVGPNLTSAPLDEFQFGLQFTQVGGNMLTIGRDSSSGIYWANAPDNEVRARVENMFDQAIGDPNIMTRMGGATFQFAFLDEVQLNAILRAVKKRERVNLVTAPKLTCFNTQMANITVRNQVAYIEDFVPMANQGVTIADPQVANAEDGLVLQIRPVISSDRRYITIEAQPTIALLKRPMETLTTTLGVAGSSPVTIQLPEMTYKRIRTTVTVPDGGSFLIGGVRKLMDVTQESGVPLLSDLPIIGNLFTRRGYSKLRSDLVIIVKARITDLREMVDYVSPASVIDNSSSR